MGSIKDLLLEFRVLARKSKQLTIDESVFKRYMAIIDSMTPDERKRPDLIDMSRRRRIANGSGVSTADVSGLLKQFQTMKKMLGKFGDVQEMVGKLPEGDELSPEQLANPQAFMPNANRLFAKRVDKKNERKAKQAKKKARQNKKKSRR